MDKRYTFRLWLSLGAIAASLILFVVFNYQLSKEIGASADEIASARALVSERSRSLEVLAGLKKNSAEVEQYQKGIRSLLPGKDDLLNFSRWLDGVARASQVGLTFQFLGGGTDPGGMGYNSFQLTLEGSYESILIFLREVEVKSTKFLVSLSGFNLSRSEEGKYRLSTQGKVYYQ